MTVSAPALETDVDDDDHESDYVIHEKSVNSEKRLYSPPPAPERLYISA